MTDLRKAAQQALEALYEETAWFGPTPKGAAAIAALKAALAQQDEQQEPCEPLEVLKRALEIIAVGDSKNPQQDAADALIDIGFWSGEGAAR